MLTLPAVALAIAAAVLLGRLPPPTRPADRSTWQRRGLVALLLLLPLVHAALVLGASRERLRMLRFDYVGKQLTFAEGRPITAGGSPSGADEIEDLYAPGLPPRSLRLLPAAAGGGEDASAARLVLASPGPAVAVDGELLNSYPLADGDEIVVDRPGREPAFVVYEGGKLRLGERQVALRGVLGRLFGGNARVYDLATLGGPLDAELSGVFSFLRHPGVLGPWHLVIRSDEVTVERGGETVARFVAEHPVAAEAEVDLGVVVNGALRSQRRDRLRIGTGEVEVRFAEPRVWTVTVPPDQAQVTLALTVPSAFARHEMIELPEPSSRFRGLSAAYEYDRTTDAATLAYFGDRQEVVPGDVYALGIGDDRLLLRLQRSDYPDPLLLDLGLLALFFAVFLGRGLVAHAGLAAVVGPLGLLLGHRLLFSYKVATQPPDFSFEPMQEARLALWLIPALLLTAWTAAWWLRRPAAKVPEHFGEALSSMAWPLAGLAVAAAGCWAVAGEGRRDMPLVPLLFAALLALGVLLLVRWQRARDALERLQAEGFPVRPVWLAGLGAALLVVRFLAAQVGMPETLRLPMVGFRLLWTVVQLPLAAAVVGVAVHYLVHRERARSWLVGLLSTWAFLGLGFLGVGLAVSDTGLFLAHALAPFVALLVLVSVPFTWTRLPSWQRLALAVLPALPLLAVLAVNAYPETLIRLVGWGSDAARSEAAGGSPVRDSAAQLGANRAQQLFRLYMLASPQRLSESGLIASERVAIHYATLQSYADEGGFAGKGYLASKLPRHLGTTYLSDLVPMVFVLPDFGKLGLLAIAALYLALLLAVPLTAAAVDADGGSGRSSIGAQGLYVALVALLSVAVPSLYMILANLNLVLFTGKNLSLLSLNSLSDVLQSGVLLALAVLGLGLERGVTK
jgi:hypothetical protein